MSYHRDSSCFADTTFHYFRQVHYHQAEQARLAQQQSGNLGGGASDANTVGGSNTRPPKAPGHADDSSPLDDFSRTLAAGAAAAWAALKGRRREEEGDGQDNSREGGNGNSSASGSIIDRVLEKTGGDWILAQVEENSDTREHGQEKYMQDDSNKENQTEHHMGSLIDDLIEFMEPVTSSRYSTYMGGVGTDLSIPFLGGITANFGAFIETGPWDENDRSSSFNYAVTDAGFYGNFAPAYSSPLSIDLGR